MYKKLNKGFTLIELVIVIVILGILSAIAAPRFLNLQIDARNAALLGLKGAMEDGIQLTYAKSVINNLEKNRDGFLNADGEVIPLTYGVPQFYGNAIEQVLPQLSDSSQWQRIDNYGYDLTILLSENLAPVDTVYTLPSINIEVDSSGNNVPIDNCFVAYTYDSTIVGVIEPLNTVVKVVACI